MSNSKYWNTGVRTGGKVVVEIDDVPIAFAQSARFRDDYGLEPVHIIGQLQTIEYVPMHARHEIQIAVLVLNKVSLASMGLEPTTSGSFGIFDKVDASTTIGNGRVGLTGAYGAVRPAVDTRKNVFTVLNNKVCDIKVYDAEPRSTQIPQGGDYATDSNNGCLVWYENCFYGGGDVSIDANRVIVHNVTFYAQTKRMVGSSLSTVRALAVPAGSGPGGGKDMYS